MPTSNNKKYWEFNDKKYLICKTKECETLAVKESELCKKCNYERDLILDALAIGESLLAGEFTDCNKGSV